MGRATEDLVHFAEVISLTLGNMADEEKERRNFSELR